METIMIVEDNRDMSNILSNFLKDEGYETIQLEEGRSAIEKVKSNIPDLVLLDIRLPGMSGMEILKKMKDLNEDLAVIMLTAYGDIRGAVKAMKLGAFDYITKPFDIEELMLTIKRALHTRYLSREVATLRKKLGEREPGQIVGQSKALKHALSQVHLVAPTNMTVIIQGESGTGKELIARLIHQESVRKDKPFIAIDCGAIPDTLLESELFGHERGAFTGAVGAREGIFEQADGGTLFLDETTNLSSSAQMKFLRVLEEKKLQHVGGKKTMDIDVRIIIATNISLAEAVRRGEFREDLFHRMNEFHIDLPPLRDREGDIPLLAEYFLKEGNREFNKNVEGISSEAMAILEDHSWSGNVRELKNVIKRAGLLCDKKFILPQHLSIIRAGSEKAVLMETKKDSSFDEIVENMETELIRKTLEKTGGNKTRAASILKMNRKTFYRKLKKLGLLD